MDCISLANVIIIMARTRRLVLGEWRSQVLTPGVEEETAAGDVVGCSCRGAIADTMEACQRPDVQVARAVGGD